MRRVFKGLGLGLVGLGLLGAPWLLPGWLLFLLSLALAKGLVVLGVLVLMWGGLVSFGHGLYFAAGAYTVAFLAKFLGVREAALGLLAAALLNGVLAGLLGLFLSRYRAIFFGMLSVAFSMILYAFLLKFYFITGGTDGLRVPIPTVLGFEVSARDIRTVNYFVNLVFGLLGLFAAWRLSRSPLGYLMRGVKDNEVRVEYMGASVKATVYGVYLFSGVLGGLGGALVALSVGHVAPDLAYWTTSGEFVFVAILGGTGSVLSPFLASALFELVRNYAIKLSPYTWQLSLGLVLLGIIFFYPEGLWGLYEWVKGRWRPKSSSKPSI
ncbi:MAG: branched-chain amino acid ABC transporter permease [Chloroflexota bacterium]